MSPRHAGGRTPVRVSLDDGAWPSLVRFAAVALVDRTGYSRADLGRRMNKTAPNFHMALFGRIPGKIDEPMTKSFVQDLQHVLHTTPGVTDGHLASRRPLTMLTGLYEELAAEGDPDSGVNVHSAWFPDLCETGPARAAVEAFVRGEALRDLLKDTRSRFEREQLLVGDNKEYARQTIVDLLSLAGSAPSRGMPATHLLARLGPVALPEIEKEIYQSPVGFRSVRVLGRMLWRAYLRRKKGDAVKLPATASDHELLDGLEKLLIKVEEQPPADPYPARSFYVEALRWAPEEWKWVPARLAQRALDSTRPVRERMYAAMLSKERGYPDMAGLVASLSAEGESRDEDGLRYAAALMNEVSQGAGQHNGWLGENGEVPPRGLRPWPPDRPESGYVNEVIKALDEVPPDILPPSVRDGAKVLVTEALLTLDGTRRRRACDVLSIAQVGAPAATAISRLLTNSEDRPPRWMREHAAFILGYLQEHESLPALEQVVSNPIDDPSVLHAAAWGIGDTCGQGLWVDHRSHVPVEALSKLIEMGPEEPRQAATYTLAVTRQPQAQHILAKIVESGTMDRLTRGLARWGWWLSEADRIKNRPDAPTCIPSSRTLILSD